MEINPMNICLDRLLSRSKNGNSQTNGQKYLYNTHIEISCRCALKAASYILVLSIIPPFLTSS
jgi:hypothetical protein